MLKKKKVRVLLVVLTVLIGFFLALNIIVETIAKDYLSKKLDLLSAKNEYVLGFGEIDINIFLGNISISNFHAKPNEQFFNSFASGESEEDALQQLFVSKISLSRLGVIDLLLNRNFHLEGIEIDELHFNFYRPHKDYELKGQTIEKKTEFSLDSIHLAGIDEIDLAEMKIADYGIHVIDASNKDTISSYQGKEFLFKGLDMNALEGNQGYFTFDHSDLELELKQQEFNLKGGLYAISFDDLHYRYHEQEIELINFELKPIASPSTFYAQFSHAYDINAAQIDTLVISGLDTYPLFQSGIISITQIDINGLRASSFKDKTKPYNLEKATNLPHMGLENMRQPLHISTIKLKNSSFVYSEKLKDQSDLVTVNLENIHGEITNITSIRDSLKKNTSLEAKLNTNLLNTLPFYMHLTMPYNTKGHTFYASGHTKGNTDFEKLNPTVYPAIGVKFENGKINEINFNFQGNPTSSTGELTMLYEDLELELYKKNDAENKTISWMANSIVKKSNPNNKGKTLVAEINFNRVKYKGFGNYLWKSIQSGIVNSIAPFGKQKKKGNSAKKK